LWNAQKHEPDQGTFVSFVFCESVAVLQQVATGKHNFPGMIAGFQHDLVQRRILLKKQDDSGDVVCNATYCCVYRHTEVNSTVANKMSRHHCHTPCFQERRNGIRRKGKK